MSVAEADAEVDLPETYTPEPHAPEMIAAPEPAEPLEHPDTAVARRLSVEDARAETAVFAPRRSSYEQVREASRVEPVAQAAVEGFDGLDEDYLRGLIREVLREELQGQMGERITRNLRKLVRREIQRAFASDQFE